jgi:hypothetical protein
MHIHTRLQIIPASARQNKKQGLVWIEQAANAQAIARSRSTAMPRSWHGQLNPQADSIYRRHIKSAGLPALFDLPGRTAPAGYRL